MPRIAAPTVVEHRHAQRTAVLRAAEDILRTDGAAALTPRAVTERLGLTRSTFYDYFPSRDDLLVALAIEAFERWNGAIAETLASVPPGMGRLRAYVEATVRMSAAREHDIARVLREAELTPKHTDDLMVLHETLMRPLQDLLGELDVPDSARAAALVEGLLGAAIRLAQHGADPTAVTADVIRLLESGLPVVAA